MNFVVKTTVFALTVIIFWETGCRKITPSEEKPIVVPTVNNNQLFIPVKLESPKQQIQLKYLENSNMLLSAEDNTGRKELIKYNKNKLASGFEIYENNQIVYSSDYFRDAGGRVNTINQFKISGPAFTPIGHLSIGYDSGNRISEVSTFDLHDRLLEHKIYTYDQQDNLIRTEIEKPSLKSETCICTYDQKKGLCNAVPNALLFNLESQYKFLFYSVTGNLLSKTAISTDKGYTCSYAYNSQNYPSKQTLMEGGLTTTFTLTYKTLP
ncbi:hypothetical protein DBR11_02420 [Pedobacter sp. HMWF019]|uniref:hypothetical protein n=1 Tax=Pedobacter sp. HMWF019 TaxID=2056856 RepID=UPI000D36F72D|nr:hypothetical protein [Pedobacter sp. HMWF019]PTT03398.1 hypothetical protein DBR11_02420 [Pedobacter sp. HMWF019]